jgi:hypothetical protein
VIGNNNVNSNPSTIDWPRMQNAWQPSAPRSLSSRRRAEGDVYIPHPAPSSVIDDEDESKMGATLSLLKVLSLSEWTTVACI